MKKIIFRIIEDWPEYQAIPNNTFRFLIKQKIRLMLIYFSGWIHVSANQKMKLNNKILNAIVIVSKVTCQSNNFDLSKSIYTKHTHPICQKLNCSAEEAVLFSIIFKLFIDGSRTVELSDIALHLGCETIELLSNDRVLKSLVKKKLISIDFNLYGEMFKE